MLANINFEYWNECYQNVKDEKRKPKSNRIKYMTSDGRRELETLTSQRYRPVELPEPSRRIKALLRENFGKDGGAWQLPLVSSSPRSSGASRSSTDVATGRKGGGGVGGEERRAAAPKTKEDGEGVPGSNGKSEAPGEEVEKQGKTRQLVNVVQSDPGTGAMPVTRRRGHSRMSRDKQAGAGGVGALKTSASSPNVLSKTPSEM